mgnify:FL=1
MPDQPVYRIRFVWLLPIGGLRWRHLLWGLPSLLLLPLVWRNYSRRVRGLEPDIWYWADLWLLHHGYGTQAWWST